MKHLMSFRAMFGQQRKYGLQIKFNKVKIIFVDRVHRTEVSSSSSSKISMSDIQSIVEQLKLQRHRQSMKDNYYGIWKTFNQFFIRLDIKPTSWENRLTLFVAYLIQNKRKSTTIKCYIFAIRAVLRNGGIKLKEDKVLLASLTQACHLHYDHVGMHLSIRKMLLLVLLKSLDKFLICHRCT